MVGIVVVVVVIGAFLTAGLVATNRRGTPAPRGPQRNGPAGSRSSRPDIRKNVRKKTGNRSRGNDGFWAAGDGGSSGGGHHGSSCGGGGGHGSGCGGGSSCGGGGSSCGGGGGCGGGSS